MTGEAGREGGDAALEAITFVVRSIADLLSQQPNLIAVDLLEIRAILEQGGLAAVGSGEASGSGRAREAASAAILDFQRRRAGLS